MTSFAISVTRSVFSILERAAPGLGGRLAFRLFSRTPDPDNTPAREREAIARFRPFMEEARLHRLRGSAGWFAAHVFKPLAGSGTGRTALVLHGWASRADHMVPIVMQLRAAGYRVVALDLPGHGASGGRSLNMATAVAACNEAALWFGPFELVVGHSFGGAVALNAIVGSVAPHAPLAADRLVLVAAPNSMPDFFAGFARHLGLGPRVRAALEARVETLSGTPLEKFVGASQLAELAVPTLLMHAPDDREVPATDAHAMAQAGSHVAVEWVEGAGHRRILSDARTLEALMNFVDGGDATAFAARRLAKRAAA